MIHDDTETAKLSEIISDLKCDSANDRDYLENTTIPAVTVALKNLLIEMKKKDLPLNATYFASKYSSEIQKDQPFEKFDAINWLGNASNNI